MEINTNDNRMSNIILFWITNTFFLFFKASTETDTNTRLAKAWTAINSLSVIWKSDLTDKIKRTFFPSSSRIDTAIWMHHMDAN